MLQAYLDRILGILCVLCKTDNGPRSHNLDSILLEIIDEDRLDPALVKHRREPVGRLDGVRAAGPGPRASDAVPTATGTPERRLVELGRLLSHDATLQAHVAQKVERARLDGVGASSLRGPAAIVDVLDAVAPSRQTGREHQTRRSRPDDDHVELRCRVDGHWFAA